MIYIGKLKKNNRNSFIFEISFFTFFAVLGLIAIFFILSHKYPNKNDLRYEDCTYIRYEEQRGTKSSLFYHVYVQGYSDPLYIDNICTKKVNKDALKNLPSGTTVTVGFFDNDTSKKLNCYSLEYNDNVVLSFEDYITSHKNNDTLGIVICSCFSAFLFGLSIFDTVLYTKYRLCF